MIALRWIVDLVPISFFQDISFNTRFLSLLLLGRASNSLIAFIAALVISVAAGYAEEICFRGFLFNSLTHSFGAVSAAVATSALFGLLHAPLLGPSTVAQMLLGAVCCYSYVASDYNIAVPIVVHALYDFMTIFPSWLLASKDLKTRIQRAENGIGGELTQSSSLSDALKNTTTYSVFRHVDITAQLMDER
mmetsp:Transcript_18642/g.31263  ORF Transcript_18642/g.31263 Transcript_18642/m.31263 type:complete len:191 (-) Transcript_18642:897-1469(-)